MSARYRIKELRTLWEGGLCRTEVVLEAETINAQDVRDLCHDRLQHIIQPSGHRDLAAQGVQSRRAGFAVFGRIGLMTHARALEFSSALIFAAIVVALYVFVGNSGVLSFGQIGFFIVGAYAAGEPTVSEADVSREMILDGRVLTERYEGNMMGRPFVGHGMTGYDNAMGKYWSTWNDNMSTGLMTSWGTWDEAKKAIVFEGDQLANLPTNRNVNSLLALTPGITSGYAPGTLQGVCSGGVGVFCNPGVTGFNVGDDDGTNLAQGRVMVDGVVVNSGASLPIVGQTPR